MCIATRSAHPCMAIERNNIPICAHTACRNAGRFLHFNLASPCRPPAPCLRTGWPFWAPWFRRWYGQAACRCLPCPASASGVRQRHFRTRLIHHRSHKPFRQRLQFVADLEKAGTVTALVVVVLAVQNFFKVFRVQHPVQGNYPAPVVFGFA